MLKPTILAAAFLLAGTAAQAAVLVSPPLRILGGDWYTCGVVNSGTKTLTSAVIDVTISGSNIGSGFSEDCGPVPVGTVCSGENEAGGSTWRYCTVTLIGSKTYVRANFCNTTKGVCVPLQ